MWSQINLLFLVLYLFTGHICCDDSEDDHDDSSDKRAGPESEDSYEKDNVNYEGHRNGKMLIVVIPVVGVLVLLILVTCRICIVKKRYRKKINTQNIQENGTIETLQLAFPTFVADNPPPYTSKMEEQEMKSALAYFWHTATMVCACHSEHASSLYPSSGKDFPPGFNCSARTLANENNTRKFREKN